MWFILSVTALSVTAIVSLFRINRWRRKMPWVWSMQGTKPRLPGGDLLDLSMNPNDFGSDKTKTYGDFYYVWLGAVTPVIVLASAKRCKQFFTQHTKSCKPHNLGLGDFFGRYLGQSLGCASGRDWGRIMKAMKKVFHAKTIDQHAETLANVIVRWGETHLKRAALSNNPINVKQLLENLTTAAASEMLFGHTFMKTRMQELDELLSLAGLVLHAALKNGQARWFAFRALNNTPNKALSEFQARWRHFLSEYFEFCEGNQQKDDVGAAVGIDRSLITVQQLDQTLAEIVFANSDVSKPTASWMLVHLAASASSQAWLQTAFDESPEFVREKWLTRGQVDQYTPWLKHFVNESARMAPLLPLSMQEITTKSCTMDGHVIPAGAHVCVEVASICNDPKFWSNPERFEPQRFEGLDMKAARWHLPRFGLGPRRCPGRHLADMMLTNILKTVVSKYEMTLVDPIADLTDIPLDPSMALRCPDVCVRVRHRCVHINIPSIVASNTPVVVGISVSGDSCFHMENTRDECARLLLSALCRRNAKSVIMITDGLSEHNEIAFSSRSAKAAERIARGHGDVIFNVLTTAHQDLDTQHKEKIHICRWAHVSQTAFYQAVLEVVQRHYDDDQNFRQMIDELATFYFSLRAPGKRLKPKRFKHTVQYILGEVPILLTGAVFHTVHHPLVVYPNSRKKVYSAFDPQETRPSLLQVIHAFHDGKLKGLRDDILIATQGMCGVRGVVAVPLDY